MLKNAGLRDLFSVIMFEIKLGRGKVGFTVCIYEHISQLISHARKG